MRSQRARLSRRSQLALGAVAALVALAVIWVSGLVTGSSPAERAQVSPGATMTATTVGADRVTTNPTSHPAATNPPTSKPAGPVRTTGRSAKKGVSTWDFAGVGPALSDVGAAWYYNWSVGPTAGAGKSADFVPMIWGADSVTAANLNRAKASGTVLLAFNEPDFAEQANMSVERALDLWPRLQATGLRLGSPAPAVGAATPGGWLDRFMAGATQRGYRVDFITVHWYGSDFSAAAVGHLRGYLQAVHDRYRMPIWLTEFALIRFGGSGAVYPSAGQQAAFITGATAMLEKLSFVQRYSWFALPTSEGRDGTGLYRDGTTPTAAGAAYRAAG